MPRCLIYNLGTQEPRWNTDPAGKRFLRLQEPDVALEQQLSQWGASPESGFRKRSEAIWTQVGEQKDLLKRLAFPILEALLPHIRSLGAGPDRVILIATAEDSRRDSDDTCFAALLAQEWLTVQAKIDSEIHQMGLSPHLLENAQEDIVAAAPLSAAALAEHDVYLCSSPGLPSVNQALLRHLFRNAPAGRFHAFQVIEDTEPRLRQGFPSLEVISVAETLLLEDHLRQVIPELARRYEFAAIASLVDPVRLPRLAAAAAAARDAKARWELEADRMQGWGRAFWKCGTALNKAEAMAGIDEFLAAINLLGDVLARLIDMVRLAAIGKEEWLERARVKRKAAVGAGIPLAEYDSAKDENKDIGIAEVLCQVSLSEPHASIFASLHTKELQDLKAVRNRLVHRLADYGAQELARDLGTNDCQKFLESQIQILRSVMGELRTALSLAEVEYPCFTSLRDEIKEQV